MTTSRNSDSYSLLILDEHLWKWIDACNYNDSLLTSPDRDDCQTLLKRILAVWPVLLKLITTSHASPRPPVWLPYIIRAADRLILAARDIPMKAIRVQINELTDKISDIELKSSKLVDYQVEKEKLVFMSNYSACHSDFHQATEYWPAWEPRVRQEATSIVRAKLDEFYHLVSERRRELEKMHLDQLTIRDKWAAMRTRLNPERYEDSSAWWGSVIKPPKRRDDSSDEELPEFISMSEARIAAIQTLNLIETSRGVTRLHLNATAAMGMSNAISLTESTPSIPWSILRSTSIDLIKELTCVLERKKNTTNPIIPQSINIVDILLRLLFSHDLSQFDDDERKYSDEIINLRACINPSNTFNPSLDPVVARFTADEKDECMKAAIEKYMGEAQSRADLQKMKQKDQLLAVQTKLNNLRDYRQINYETPWKDVWESWNKVIGSSVGSSKVSTPNISSYTDNELPPLRYTS